MELVKSIFYWPGMDGDIKKYVRNCPRCIRKKAQGKTTAKLVVVDSTYPMDLVCMDVLSLEMSAGGYEHILVITDHFTRYAQAIPTRNQSAKTTARILFDNFICHYGFPASYTVTKVATLKVKLLRSCVMFRAREKLVKSISAP